MPGRPGGPLVHHRHHLHQQGRRGAEGAAGADAGAVGQRHLGLHLPLRCVRILRRDIDRLGFTSSFTIYDTADSERVIKDIVKDFNLDEKAFAPRSILAIFPGPRTP